LQLVALTTIFVAIATILLMRVTMTQESSCTPTFLANLNTF